MFRRSTRVGELIFLIGMVGRDEDGAVRGSGADQAKRSLTLIERELAKHGASRQDIVRIRMFMTDIDEWPAIRDVIEEFFGHDSPPGIAMSVQSFVEPEIRVELEVDAARSSDDAGEVIRA